MKHSKKFLLASLLILSSTAYSAELLNKDGFILDSFGLLNVGLSTKTYKIDDYTNTKSGIDEDTAWFQLGLKKKLGAVEAGAHLRYGAGFEANGDRVGGDMYIKYNFNDKMSLEYAKSDFAYTNSTDYGNIVGKNLGTGTQLELTPEGMLLEPVLSTLEVDYGTAFLGAGLNGLIMTDADFTPDGAIWSAHMAYKENALNHDLKPGAANFYYNGDKSTLAVSAVYENRDSGDFINDNGTSDNPDDNYTESVKSTDKGITIKGTYSLSNKSKLGGGITYGDGKTDSSLDSSDIETNILSQNLWYKTNIASFDFMTEVAHSNYEVDSSRTLTEFSFDVADFIENRFASEKELIGAYAKVSKFTKYGIPAVELKIAQSTFDKAFGIDLATPQENTLLEIKPSFIIPSHKAPGLLYGFNAIIGSYKSENAIKTDEASVGAVGMGHPVIYDSKSTQFKIGTSITYIF